MQNAELRITATTARAGFSILHSAFCVLHSGPCVQITPSRFRYHEPGFVLVPQSTNGAFRLRSWYIGLDRCGQLVGFKEAK